MSDPREDLMGIAPTAPPRELIPETPIVQLFVEQFGPFAELRRASTIEEAVAAAEKLIVVLRKMLEEKTS